MKKYALGLLIATAFIGFVISCSESSTGGGDSCTLNDNTTDSTTTNSYGCALTVRDTSSCQDSRTAQGLSGFWLKFSCRVTLTKSGANVTIAADSQPDHLSPYFGSSNACYEAMSISGRSTNPNTISAQTISMSVPYAPTTTTATAMSLGVVGIALNAVSIYSNAAAPGDNIYSEVATFDKCEGHPDSSSRFHYHIEPPSISNADYAFIGVMRDGFPVYGKKDMDGSTPTLDSAGGHTGITVDSNGAAVYHYHVNLQTSGANSAYFITSGYYKGTTGTCTGC